MVTDKVLEAFQRSICDQSTPEDEKLLAEALAQPAPTGQAQLMDSVTIRRESAVIQSKISEVQSRLDAMQRKAKTPASTRSTQSAQSSKTIDPAKAFADLQESLLDLD